MPNPTQDDMGWYWWRDETGHYHGPYILQENALRDLLRHNERYLRRAERSARWTRFKQLVKEFIAA